MTIEDVGIALRTETPSATAKLVLVALAEAANAEDGVAWPSVRTMATYAQCSESTLKRHRDALIDVGLIEPIDPAELSPARLAQYESLPPNRRPRPYRILLGAQIDPPVLGGHSSEPSTGSGGSKRTAWGFKTEGLGGHSYDPQTGIPKPELLNHLGGQSEPSSPTSSVPDAAATRALLDAEPDGPVADPGVVRSILGRTRRRTEGGAA